MTIFVSLLITSCFHKTAELSDKSKTNNENLDTAFVKFVSKFKDADLPFEFDALSLPSNLFNGRISESDIMKYLSRNDSTSLTDKNGNKLDYGYFCKFTTDSNYLVTYFVFDEITHENKIVLTSFGKHEHKPICDLILMKDNNPNDEVMSYITIDRKIKTEQVISYLFRALEGKFGCYPNKAYPNYFYVTKISSEYQIENSGHISLSNCTSMQYLGYFDALGKEVYPVEPPNKEIKRCNE